MRLIPDCRMISPVRVAAMRRIPFGAAFAAMLLLGCRAEPFARSDYNPAWTNASHGPPTPNYAVALPQDSVNRIDIYLKAAGWTAVRQNMKELWGFDFGDGGHPCCGPYRDDPSYVDVEVGFNGRIWK